MKIRSKILITAAVVTTLFVGCASSQKNQEHEMSTNKNKVIELLNSIQTGDTGPVRYINEKNYTQHNLAVKDGIQGFGEILSLLPKGSAKVKVVRSFQDGDYVFTHTKYNFFGPKAGFDIFRFEDGKIVEHWDNLQEIVEKTASGRTQFDGETNVTDRDKTESNKTLIKNFLFDVLLGNNPSKITQYISTEKYLQHNPHIKDGLAGLGEAIENLNKANMPMKYEKNHILLGEGSFVLSVSEGLFMNKHVSFYDLFRIEDGKIVEHWDTIEEILPKDKWQNTNGKF
ncbi:MAG: hypothetical protein COA66_14935 [Arcobacter sp.]|nr:MAG: hypothetical protein COA66_14935 [Arcobacter sp.]